MHRLGIILFALLLASCAGIRLDSGEIFQKERREPGEKRIAPLAGIAQAYGCDQKRRPFVSIEENEIVPTRLYPGEEFNHQFIYVMCPGKRANVVTGDLYRRIYFNGKVVFKDVSKNFEIKPGKWSVDAFITIPPQAKPGVYSLSLTFNNYRNKITLSKIHHLVVLKR